MSMITMTMIEDMAKITVRWRTDIFFISLTATVYTLSIIILTLESVLFHGKKYKKRRITHALLVVICNPGFIIVKRSMLFQRPLQLEYPHTQHLLYRAGTYWL